MTLKEENVYLRAALTELLYVTKHILGGDSSFNNEEWYAARDFTESILDDKIVKSIGR